jgi:hypothetical protein
LGDVRATHLLVDRRNNNNEREQTMRLDNRQDLDKLRAAMNTALAKVADELGLEKLRASKVSYESGGAGARITVEAAVNIDGKTKDEIAWEQYAAMFGLELGWLHQTFEHKRNQVVEIIGLAPTRSRFPVMVKDAKTGNANILLTIEEVQRKLGKGNTPIQIQSFSALGPLTRVTNDRQRTQ